MNLISYINLSNSTKLIRNQVQYITLHTCLYALFLLNGTINEIIFKCFLKCSIIIYCEHCNNITFKSHTLKLPLDNMYTFTKNET